LKEDRDEMPLAEEALAEDHTLLVPEENVSAPNVETDSSTRLVSRATALPVPNVEQE